jgi:hypothetical protein
MNISNYLKILLIIFLLAGCSKKSKDISPDTDEAIESSEKGEKPSFFLQDAEPFYPLKETVEDIQAQLNDLHARVIEYEMRVSTPSFNTEVLKMIKVPQLNHEINLTNGTLIQGTIIQENMDQIIVQTQIGQLTIDKGNVEVIKEIAPASAKINFDGDADEKIMAESRMYSGTVTNTGLHRGDFVRIIYQLWGGETDLISSDSTFIEGSQVVYHSGIMTDTALRPGETAEFFLEIKSPSDKKVQYITRDIHWESYE